MLLIAEPLFSNGWNTGAKVSPPVVLGSPTAWRSRLAAPGPLDAREPSGVPVNTNEAEFVALVAAVASLSHRFAVVGTHPFACVFRWTLLKAEPIAGLGVAACAVRPRQVLE